MDRNQIALLVVAVGIFLASLRFGGSGAPPVPPAGVPAPITSAAPGAPASAAGPAAAGEAGAPPSVAPGPGDGLEQAESVEVATLSNGALSIEVSNAGAQVRSARLR